MVEEAQLQTGPRPARAVREGGVGAWEPHFCVLLQDEQTLTAYRSEELAVGDALFVDLPRVRLDGGVKAFRQRWGYELQPPPTLLEEEEDGGGNLSVNGNQDPEVASINSPTGSNLYS
ncbi:Ras GTPase-activating protein raskol [Frankliniella fusca]|uniref:Ras GTPase-activating protein raskol n=1 Tax=Frankliniella fusca TaxID=407009 RepID=A0AAE1GS93_9NEOP|nr:Ras GTPase-activating protein raskol [Frankliniella fusca]